VYCGYSVNVITNEHHIKTVIKYPDKQALDVVWESPSSYEKKETYKVTGFRKTKKTNKQTNRQTNSEFSFFF